MAARTVATVRFPTNARTLSTIPVSPCWPRSPATYLNLPMIDSKILARTQQPFSFPAPVALSSSNEVQQLLAKPLGRRSRGLPQHRGEFLRRLGVDAL